MSISISYIHLQFVDDIYLYLYLYLYLIYLEFPKDHIFQAEPSGRCLRGAGALQARHGQRLGADHVLRRQAQAFVGGPGAKQAAGETWNGGKTMGKPMGKPMGKWWFYGI